LNHSESQPRVAIVMPTCDRPALLAKALEAFRVQTLARDSFEIIVIDDASGPATGAVLAEFQSRDDRPPLTVLRNERRRGMASSRNRGWRLARAPLVAFTDDDCASTPAWLEHLCDAARANPDAIVVGPTLPDPAASEELGEFVHTLSLTELGRWFETANILYPRALLERVDGFDEVAFNRWGGSDTDLAWRSLKAGARPVWAPDAIVHHAVVPVGAIGRLRAAARWHQTALCYKRHPVLRKELAFGLFRTREHALLLLALAAVAIPGLPRVARVALALPYARRLYGGRRTPVIAPYRVALDIIEIAACARGAIRYRVPLL
jgi:glycosyltransferase involved in cell wall biosynthesis